MNQPEPIRKSLLPCTPPPEWQFSTVLGAPHGCMLLPGDTGPVVIRRQASYGDWEPVRPDHWAPEPAGSCTAAANEIEPNKSGSGGCHCGLGTPNDCATKPWGCANDHDHAAPDAASQPRTAPDNPVSSGDLPNGRPRCPRCHLPHDLDGWPDDLCRNLTEELAQAAIPTPGCDCGHDGMGVRWHANDCAWRTGRIICERCGHSDGEGCGCPTVAARRNAPDLRELVAAAIRTRLCQDIASGRSPLRGEIGAYGAATEYDLADVVLAVVDAALPDRAQAAIRALEQQVLARDARLEVLRGYVRIHDCGGAKTRAEMMRILGTASGEPTP